MIKKIALLSVLCAFVSLSAYAQKKGDFVQEKDLMKIQAPGKDAVWPDAERLFDKDVKNGKSAADAWKVENGELVSVKENEPLFIKKNRDQFHIIFEFTCAEDAEGYFFLRAPRGKVDEAVKVKLAGKNGDNNVQKIGSIDGQIYDVRGNINEPKGEKWVRIIITVEGDSMRVSDPHKMAADYANRNLGKTTFAKIAEKAKREIPSDGDIGFVVTKGEIKFKNIYMTQF